MLLGFGQLGGVFHRHTLDLLSYAEAAPLKNFIMFTDVCSLINSVILKFLQRYRKDFHFSNLAGLVITCNASSWQPYGT